MKAILAVNNLGFIGFRNGLPWNCGADLKHFKRMTMGCNLVVGYNTSEGLPLLGGRKVFVFGRDSFSYDEIDFCIGGKATYERLCHFFTELHISHINDNTIGDVVAPNLMNLNLGCKVFNYYFDVDIK